MIIRLLIPLLLLVNAPLQKLQVERLPDMSVPRSFPAVSVTPDGSIYALGGYTTGFVPLASAEVFRDGEWRGLPPMNYPHAGAFSLTLKDGSVMLGGGSAEAFGIGQTLGVEMFDPASGTFNPLGILPGKRALSSAVMLPDSTVVVSGNWYAPDDIVLYTADDGLSILKPVAEERSSPFMFPTPEGDVLIFGGSGTRGEDLDGWVDCLKGDPFRPALFEEYLPYILCPSTSDGYALGGGNYLFPVLRRSDGQIAIACVQGKEFSLLPSDEPVPMAFPDGAPVYWGRLLVDRVRRKAYMPGFSKGHGCAVLVVDYDQALDGGEAHISFLYAPDEDGPFPYECRPVLLRPGQIALLGGRMEDNFHPVSTAFILHLVGSKDTQTQNSPMWPWILVSALLLGLAAGLYLRRGKQDRKGAIEEPIPATQTLSEQIAKLIEEEQLYLQKGLRMSDVAAQLATNKTYISAVVNSVSGTNFTDLINGYRVEYAKKIMKEHPQMRHEDIADAAGFSSRTAFLRVFKKHTGLSPTEWKEGRDN